MSTFIFYHIAAMGHWREVASEQMRLMAAGGRSEKVCIGFSGSKQESGFVWHTAKAHGLQAEILFCDSGLENYEFPTLNHLRMACEQGLCDRVIYLHTKGVSHRNDWRTMMWRWLLNYHLLRNREESLRRLEAHEWCAPIIQQLHPAWDGHSMGNFWAARAEHIRGLPPLEQYRTSFMKECVRLGIKARYPWMHERHAAEMWIGSRPARKAALETAYKPSSGDIHKFFCNNPAVRRFLALNGA